MAKKPELLVFRAYLYTRTRQHLIFLTWLHGGRLPRRNGWARAASLPSHSPPPCSPAGAGNRSHHRYTATPLSQNERSYNFQGEKGLNILTLLLPGCRLYAQRVNGIQSLVHPAFNCTMRKAAKVAASKKNQSWLDLCL